MARRTGRNSSENNNTAEAPAEAQNQEDAVATATVEEPTSEAPENENETVTEETPEGGTTEVAAEGGETAAPAPEPVIDLSEFERVVAEVVAEADKTTGVIATAELAKITAVYRGLEGVKAKNRAKAFVNERMADAMNNAGDLAMARSYFQIGDEALVASNKSGSSTADRVPSDPTEAFVQRVAVLSMAYSLTTSNVPDGVAENWQDKVNEAVDSNYPALQELAAWNEADAESRGDEPDVPALVKQSYKLAAGRGPGRPAGRKNEAPSGPRGNIANHILAAFAGKEPGTFLKINDIRKAASEDYPAGTASQGAISARLFPAGEGAKSAMLKHGVRPEVRDGKKGAVLVNADGSPIDE